MKKIAHLLLLAIIITACSPEPQLSSFTPVQTLTITVPSTPSAAATAAAIATIPIPIIDRKCIDDSPTPSGVKPKGVIVLWDNEKFSLVMQDNETGNQTAIPRNPESNQLIIYAYVSPNKKWLLYVLEHNAAAGKWVITKAEGVPQKLVPEEQTWAYGSWVNNETLKIKVYTDDSVTQTLESFSPFTGEMNGLRSDFPQNAEEPSLDWGFEYRGIDLGITKGIDIVYDPTLGRIVYPKVGGIVSLFDVTQDAEIAQVSIPGWGRFPQWSSDGKYLTIIGTMSSHPADEALDEFLIVPRDGPDFKRLTYLTNAYKQVSIGEFAWSPDGGRIAFWLNTDETNPPGSRVQSSLVVLDLNSGKMTDYCISGIASTIFDPYKLTSAKPIWSPDGSELLISRYDPRNDSKIDVVLVDLAKRVAYKIAENLEPVGWMLKGP